MSKHTHDWKLVDSYDSRKPKSKPVQVNTHVRTGGFFGGGYISSDGLDAHRELLDIIRETYEPSYASETWACHCGERKTNSHVIPSPFKQFKDSPEVLSTQVGLGEDTAAMPNSNTKGEQK